MISLGSEPAAFLREALGALAAEHAAGAGGRELARKRADVVDLALISLFRKAETEAPWGPYREAGLAVVALGGYGRRELCPFSDIDLMLLYRPEEQPRVEAVAETLFYPLWDAALELGHGARTVDECLDVAAESVELLTSFFQARLLVGDQRLFRELLDRLHSQATTDGGGAFLANARRAREARHAAFGDTHALLEPHLKEGRGGLRDVHEALWLTFVFGGGSGYDGLAQTGWLAEQSLTDLEAATNTLLRARTSLHYAAGRKVDRAYFDYQADLAAQFRAPAPPVPADRVLAEISAAAEAVAVITQDVWHAVSGVARLPGEQPEAAASLSERPAQRATDLLELLRAGSSALPALESLSHRGILSSWLPGWESVRFLGQRESFHTFTVDGHSMRCALAAAEPESLGEFDQLAQATVEALRGTEAHDALLLACLLHDLGKGLDGVDHAEVGATHVVRVVAGLGFPMHLQDLVAFLVRHHLLLPDTASRRDIDDPSLVERVAGVVGDRARLELLYVLTVADSVATGRAVWSPWTAALVRELFFKVLGALDDTTQGGPPAWHKAIVGNGAAASEESTLEVVVPASAFGRELVLSVTRGALPGVQELTLVTPPLVGLLARVSGVLAYHAITILSAQVQPTVDGMVARSFRVSDYFEEEIPPARWRSVAEDLGRALEGRIGLDHRLAEKAARYLTRAPLERRTTDRVVVENGASDAMTVIEVHATDRIGLLYTLAKTLDDLLLDVRLAKVSTMKERAVDVFYVADANGAKVTDPEHVREVEKAVLFALSRGSAPEGFV